MYGPRGLISDKKQWRGTGVNKPCSPYLLRSGRRAKVTPALLGGVVPRKTIKVGIQAPSILGKDYNISNPSVEGLLSKRTKITPSFKTNFRVLPGATDMDGREPEQLGTYMQREPRAETGNSGANQISYIECSPNRFHALADLANMETTQDGRHSPIDLEVGVWNVDRQGCRVPRILESDKGTLQQDKAKDQDGVKTRSQDKKI
ncbi:hypothetical protein NDU88_003676 [Pleurodeles waltl]|uniref:Uncharacterized protein n=1 Tax=Pleurodeles waltl TaxID=8319 RepID=A0AAV7WTG8_PLEWA|nr:hypothetical protein NDU88_003676 [Pleurodeles waltl]